MEETSSPWRPVAAIGPARLRLEYHALAAERLEVIAAERRENMAAELPLFTNRPDWQVGDARCTRALIVLHGRLRNADAYFEVARDAAAGLDTLLIAPQFLTELDAAAHAFAPQVLRWEGAEWMAGAAASAPAPITGFTALDALFDRLCDRDRFPALQSIVFAGHSGGGQVAQRYAILTRHGERLRFVIANPSSYAYFSPERPAPDGGFAVPPPNAFPGYNRWRFGMADRPADAAGSSDAALERRYLEREVVYALGAADCDTAHPALDRSPQAQAQGANRLERGRNYFRYLHARHGESLHHRLIEIPGVGHDPGGMFGSPLLHGALFGTIEI
jgi:hypothetical protein